MVRIPKQTETASFGRATSLEEEDGTSSFIDAINDVQAERGTTLDTAPAWLGLNAGPDPGVTDTSDLTDTLVQIYEASGRGSADARTLIEAVLDARGGNALADQIQLLVRDERPSDVTADSFEKLGIPADLARDAARVFVSLADQTGDPAVAWQGVWSLMVDGADGQPSTGLVNAGYDGIDAALDAILMDYGLNPAE